MPMTHTRQPRDLPRPSTVTQAIAAVQRRALSPARPGHRAGAVEAQADRVAAAVTSSRPAQACACDGGCGGGCGDLDARTAAVDAIDGGLGVRIHTGPVADDSARLMGARAYTVGSDIVLGRGARNDNTLAHEFAHVAQQALAGGRALQRQADPLQMTVTAQWAQRLTDHELDGHLAVLRSHLTTLDPQDPAAMAARDNFIVLQTEVYRRAAGLHPAGAGQDTVPRPPGLPAHEGFTLLEIADAPPDLVEAMPEGRVIDTLPAAHVSSAQQSSSVSGIVAGTSGGALYSSASYLHTYGFAAGGQNTIGLVSFPQYGSPGHTGLPQSRLLWGHTAVYARVDGRIQIIRSHAPQSLLGTLAADRGGAVKTGRLGVPGAIYGESYLPGRGIPMFTHTGAQSIEYPVSRAAAMAAAESLPDIGPHGLRYTGVPATAGLCQGVNCLRWASPVVEGQMGGPFGPMTGQGAPTSVSDIGKGGVPGGALNQASQGRMYGWMQEAGIPGRQVIGYDSRTGARVFATLTDDGRIIINALPEHATGPPTVGGMSSGMRYLRWGGRAFFVIGIVTGGAEIALAEPEQRARVATGVAGGFGGGWVGGVAGGAAAGLACGPGAPVCVVIGGIIGGVIGGMAGRSLAEFLFDYDREAYREGVRQFLVEIKSRAAGYAFTDSRGVQWYMPPDPRYAPAAQTIRRRETGEIGGCQTCHELNYHWGQIVSTPSLTRPVPVGGGAPSPTFNPLSEKELRRIMEWTSDAPPATAAPL